MIWGRLPSIQLSQTLYFPPLPLAHLLPFSSPSQRSLGQREMAHIFLYWHFGLLRCPSFCRRVESGPHQAGCCTGELRRQRYKLVSQALQPASCQPAGCRTHCDRTQRRMGGKWKTCNQINHSLSASAWGACLWWWHQRTCHMSLKSLPVRWLVRPQHQTLISLITGYRSWTYKFS